MPKVKLNPLFAGISGTMGDLVFKRTANGQTILARRPRKTNAEPSPAQNAQRERFKLASAYARAALADPDVRAIYEERAAKERKSAYALARTDYYDGKDLLSNK